MDEKLFLRITMVGDSGVGKTCVIKRHINQKFNNRYFKTREENYWMNELKYKNKLVIMQVIVCVYTYNYLHYDKFILILQFIHPVIFFPGFEISVVKFLVNVSFYNTSFSHPRITNHCYSEE